MIDVRSFAISLFSLFLLATLIFVVNYGNPDFPIQISGRIFQAQVALIDHNNSCLRSKRGWFHEVYGVAASRAQDLVCREIVFLLQARRTGAKLDCMWLDVK